jgi:hypothetical protein
MQTVKWKELKSSDAVNCDECNEPLMGGEVRLLGEFGSSGQAVVHRACKPAWETRTGYIAAS